MSAKLDAVDRAIVAVVDGRLPWRSRAASAPSPNAPCATASNARPSGVIQIAAIVDPHAVGFGVIADVSSTSSPELQDVAATILEFESVSYLAGR